MSSQGSDQIFSRDPVLGSLREQDIASRMLAQLLALAAVWHHRHRTRRQLAELDATALRDIGIDRNQARREARKPFWLA